MVKNSLNSGSGFKPTMASVFRKALEYLEKASDNPRKLPSLILDFPEIREGDYIINLYLGSNPPLLGTKFPEPKIDFSPPVLRQIMRIGFLHGLSVHRVGEDIYYLREGEVVAVLRRDLYAASEPSLYEEIGREIYGLGGRPEMEFDRPLSWGTVLKLGFKGK